MATWDIAIKIGTSFTSIFLSGNGIVLHEPTMIAFLGGPQEKRVKAVGYDAYEMLGKVPEKTTVVSPVIDGIIEDPGVCSILLAEFLGKLYADKVIKPRINAIVGVPAGLTVDERKMYEDVCFGAAINNVTLIDNVILSGIGIDLPVESSCGGVIVNIGGGITEVAVLSMCGIIKGCSVTIGGNMMDKAIVDFIAGKYNLRVGINTARRLKVNIGSFYKNDISKMKVSGLDLRTNNIATMDIFASDIMETLVPYYRQIAEAVEGIINVCPPDIASDIFKTGIYFTGGGSRILGLDKFFYESLNLKINIPEEPEYAKILGGGKLLSNDAMLHEILRQR